jgi:hypothetical protein
VSIKALHSLILVLSEFLALYDENQILLPTTLRDILNRKPGYQAREKFRMPPTVIDEQIRRMITFML